MRYRTFHALWLPIVLLLIVPSTAMAQEANLQDEQDTRASAELFALLAEHGDDQIEDDPAAPAEQAQQGETIQVLLNHVRADQREQFERFLEERLIPAVLQQAQDDPQTRQAFRHTRILEPTEANEDGTWTYVFLLDPVIEGVSYSISDLFEEVYSEAEAQQYYEEFQEALDRPQEAYVLQASERW